MELVKNKVFEPVRSRFLTHENEATFEKEVSFALQAINGSKQLMAIAQHNLQSIHSAVYNISLTGLTLNPINALAHLIPKKGVCVLMPSYQGLVKLITDTGSVGNVYAHVVYEGDDFETSLGTSVNINHVPHFKSKIITHVYAVGVLANGSHSVEVMDIEEIEKIMDMSDAYQAFKGGRITKTPWENWTNEMAKKSAIKRLCKFLPKTDRWDKLNEAIGIDNTDFPSSGKQDTLIESLAMTCTLPNEEAHEIMKEVGEGISSQRAGDLINYLNDNQQHVISDRGGNTNSMAEINKAVDEKVDDEKS